VCLCVPEMSYVRRVKEITKFSHYPVLQLRYTPIDCKPFAVDNFIAGNCMKSIQCWLTLAKTWGEWGFVFGITTVRMMLLQELEGLSSAGPRCT